jgi:hypothetical protein
MWQKIESFSPSHPAYRKIGKLPNSMVSFWLQKTCKELHAFDEQTKSSYMLKISGNLNENYFEFRENGNGTYDILYKSRPLLAIPTILLPKVTSLDSMTFLPYKLETSLVPTQDELRPIISRIKKDLIRRCSIFVSETRHYSLSELRIDTIRLHFDEEGMCSKLVLRPIDDIHFRFRLVASGELPAFVDDSTEFVFGGETYQSVSNAKNLDKDESNDDLLKSKPKNAVEVVTVIVEVLSCEAQSVIFDNNPTQSSQLYHDILFLWGSNASRPPMLCGKDVVECFDKIGKKYEACGQLKALKNGMLLPHTIPIQVPGIYRRNACLLWGPPGTGKSSISRDILASTGFHPLWFGTVAELKRPYIGETEKAIKRILDRCKLFPHLLCCLVIDEIDTLAPKRDTSNIPNHKQDWLSLLLRIMDSYDYPNFFLIGCTNRKHSIDEAILRPGRMSSKYYFGPLRNHEVVSLVKKLGYECGTQIRGDFYDLARVSINFTGAMVRQCFLGLFTKILLSSSKVKEDFTIANLVEEFLNIQHEKLKEIPILTEQWAPNTRFYSSMSKVLQMIASAMPRLVIFVDSIGEKSTLSEHLSSIIEELTECSKAGGAIVVLDVETLANLASKELNDECRWFNFNGDLERCVDQKIPKDWNAAYDVKPFKECSRFAHRNTYYRSEKDFMTVVGYCEFPNYRGWSDMFLN